MLYIILVGLFCQDLRIQECGMLWVHAMKELVNFLKLISVIKEHNHRKIVKE